MAACTLILEAESLASGSRVGARAPSPSRPVVHRESAPSPGRHSAPATPSAPRRPSSGAAAPLVLPSPPHSPNTREPPTSRSTSLPEITLVIIQKQLAKKKELEILVEKERDRLTEMKKREKELEEDLKTRTDPNYLLSKVETLKEEIATLRTQCNWLAQQVFQKNRGGEWKCSMCTARNNPHVNLCEVCGMARLTGIPTEQASSAPPLNHPVVSSYCSSSNASLIITASSVDDKRVLK